MAKPSNSSALEIINEHREYLVDKYRDIIEAEEFWFQKAVDAWEELKMLASGEPVIRQGVDPIVIDKEVFDILLVRWVNSGNNIAEFRQSIKNNMEEYYSITVDLIFTLFAYLFPNSWQQEKLNQYPDRRTLYNGSTVNVKSEFEYFLQWGTNSFKSRPSTSSTDEITYFLIQYLVDLKLNVMPVFQPGYNKSVWNFLLGVNQDEIVFKNSYLINDLFNLLKIKIVTPENQLVWLQKVVNDPEIRPYWDSNYQTDQLIDNTFLSGIIPKSTEKNTTRPPQRVTLPHKFLPYNDFSRPDQLGVMDDIKAFASLLAYKNASPPLAIGLFGNWGSGKSYFMENIKMQIEALPKNKEYCENIVHVRFNSWHYTDANLWASLVTEIFKELNRFSDDEEGKDVEALYSKLQHAGEGLEKVRSQILLLDTRKHRVEERIAAWFKPNSTINPEEWLHKEDDGFGDLNARKVLEIMLENDDVQSKVDEVAQLLHIPPDKLNSMMEDFAENLQNDGDGFRQKWQVCKSAVYKFLGSIGVLGGILILIYLFQEELHGQLAEVFQYESHKLTAWITHGTASIGAFVTFVRPYFKRLNKGLEKFRSLRGSFNAMKKKATETIRTRISILYEQKMELELEMQEAQQEIEDIRSGKKLGEFIKEKANDSRYKDQLGIISWIREDFEQLDQLMKQQREVQLREDASPPQEMLRIDRIILYIDDLDRCDAQRVVEVLEAVHLLLAFELFGVVVGVDPRWISGALSVKYGKLLAMNDLYVDENGEKIPVNPNRANSYNYLEKIFQIPFSLHPMEESATRKLIGALLKEKNEEVQTAEVKPTNIGLKGADSVGLTKKVIKEEESTERGKASIDEKTSDLKSLLESGHPLEEHQVDPARLHILEEEIAFIQELSTLIGNTPRTIQRFVNVYRLLRAHPAHRLATEFSLEHRCIIVLLAIVIGTVEKATLLLGELIQLEIDGNSIPFEKVLAKIDAEDFVIGKLQKEVFGDVLRAEASVFFPWMRLVSRFSFRSMESVA